MRRGERTPSKPIQARGEDDQGDLVRAIGRLMGLIGGLSMPGAKLRVGLALLLTIVSKVLAVLSPLALAEGLNRLSKGDQNSGSFFLIAVGIWGMMRFVSLAAPQLRDALFQPISEEAQRRAGVKTFSHVHALSIDFHQTKRTGGLQRVIERGVRAIDFLLRFLAFNIGPTVIELAFAAVLLWVLHGPLYAAIAVGTVGLYAWVTFGITEWRLKFRKEMNETDQEASSRAVDSLLNYETVKAFAAEARETARYDQAVAAYAKAAARSYSSLALLNSGQSLIMSTGLCLMVVAGGFAVLDGRMGVGDVTALMLIMFNLYTPLNVLGFAYREIKQASVDIDAMYRLLDEQPKVADRQGARDLAAQAGEIAFDGVAFAHDGRIGGVSDLSFLAPAGKVTALVGPSGAGKSTILKLLFRFYDPQAGAVRIDGVDLRDVRQESLRQILGLVPQDVVLFNDTIRYNIAYGRPDASDDDLRQAARRARLLDFIEALPQGWETRVGERGLKLSGGEKQRVGIARVILKDPKILVLDEATSSLDSRTEAQVQDALAEASAGRTTLVVAHRLSTIANADQILVLKDGRIVERGRHDALVALNGEYAALWARQAEGAKAEAA